MTLAMMMQHAKDGLMYKIPLKFLLIAMNIMSFIAVLITALMAHKLKGSKEAHFSIGLILPVTSSFFIGATIPLFYEIAVEFTHPVPEGTSSGILTFLRNLLYVLLVVVPEKTGQSDKIEDSVGEFLLWLIIGGLAFSVVLLLFINEEYKRYNIDHNQVDYTPIL